MHTVSSQQSSNRIAPLAMLPVFFHLRGKRAVVIGGTEPAAWKIELLAAAGAQVEVFAEEVCGEVLALAPPSCSPSPVSPSGRSTLSPMGRGTEAITDPFFSPSGRRWPAGPDEGDGPTVILHLRAWTEADLTGAAIAIADIEDDADALAFVAAAKAAGVPYNVIDRPEFCQFQFGGIVNRSPVVIGISTAGAAPILGQAVRRRIETLMPQGLSAWAKLAERVRSKVMEALPAGPQRRVFWEGLADKAFGDRLPEDKDAQPELVGEMGGRVTLVGAGPGEAELLTIKAVRALQSADVILFDDLVSDEVLELARREARRMLVGKRAGRDSCRQEDINAMMLSLARQGKHVVRLKSGDPMIFGRAGEEIESLAVEGIPVSVVPGVTAGLALASRLGVSLTHRDHAQSVRFVTGHSRKGDLPASLDWVSLSDSRTTNVFYMARRMLPRIVEMLDRHGMAMTTPASVAINLGRANERIWRGSLSELVAAAETMDIDAPTLVAIGDALGAGMAAKENVRRVA